MAINPTFKVTGTEAKGLLYGLLAMDIQQLRDNPQWYEPSLYERIASGEVKYRQRDDEEHWKTIREMIEEIDRDGVTHSDCEDLACWLAAERRVKHKVQSHPFAYSPKDGLFHVVTADPAGSSSYGRQGSESWPGALMAPGVKGYELRDPSAKAGMPTTHVEGYGAVRGREDMQEEYGKIGDVTRAFGEGLGLGSGGVSSLARAIGEGVREAVDIPSAQDAGKLVGEMVADGLFPTLTGSAINGDDELMDQTVSDEDFDEDFDEELLAMEDIDLLEDDMEDYGTLGSPPLDDWLFDDPEHDILLEEIDEAIEEEDEMAADEGLGEEFGAFNVNRATSTMRTMAGSGPTKTGIKLKTGTIGKKIRAKKIRRAHAKKAHAKKAQAKRRRISSSRKQHSQRAGQRSGGSRGSTQSRGGSNVIIRHISTEEQEPQVICVDEQGYEIDCPPENSGYDDQGYDAGGQADYYEEQYGRLFDGSVIKSLVGKDPDEKLFTGKILGGTRLGRGASRVFTPSTAFDTLISDARTNLDNGQEAIAKRLMGKAMRTMAKLERKDSGFRPSDEAREMLHWFRTGRMPSDAGAASTAASYTQGQGMQRGARRRRPRGLGPRRRPQGAGPRRRPQGAGPRRRSQGGRGQQQGQGARRALPRAERPPKGSPAYEHIKGAQQSIQRGPRDPQQTLRGPGGQMQRPERHGPPRFQRPRGPSAHQAPMASSQQDDYGYIDRDDLFDMDEAVFAGVNEFMGDDE